MHASDFSAVIFDWDGVLADTTEMHITSFVNAFQTNGIVIRKNEFRRTYVRELAGLTTIDAVKKYSQMLGLSFSFETKEDTAKLKNAFFEILACYGTRFNVGADTLVMNLHHIGKPIGIASGARSHRLAASLKEFKLSSLFGCVVCAEDVKHGKPAADVWLAAAEKLNVAPSSCLAIDDSQSGIDGAISAGMSVIPFCFDPLAKNLLIKKRCNSLAEVYAYLFA